MLMQRRSLIRILVGAGIAEVLWLGFALFVVPPIIASAYRGDSLPFINTFFVDLRHHPVDFFLQHWQKIATLGAFAWPAMVGFAGFLFTPSLTRKYVGEATPEALAAIRILTCGILLLSTLWEDLPSSAALPRALVTSMGLIDALYALPIGFASFVASAEMLFIFQWVTAILLWLGLIGWRTRLVVPLGALGYLILGGIMRHYAWFYHTGLIPLYVLIVLAFTPCAEAWSCDRWRKIRQGQPVPDAERPAAVYGWSRYACWFVIAVPYVAAGLSKLRNGGLLWWEADNFRQILYRSTLRPMQFDFDVSLALTSAPDSVIELLALSALLGEILYGLVLFSRRARVILPCLMFGMHLGILLLQNILFFDLLLLQLAFCDVTWLRQVLRKRLRRWQGKVAAVASPPPAVAPSAPPVSRAYPTLIFVLSCIMLFCWLCRLEFYPFTGMQMFSDRQTTGVITYEKALAHLASGEVIRAPIEEAIGATADSRYRRILGMAFEDEAQDTCQTFFQTCAQRWNQRVSVSERILRFEVQRWEWNFAAEPDHPTYGRLVSRRFYPSAPE